MEPEQALEHSEEVNDEDLAKLVSLMDDHGSIPEHAEAYDEEPTEETPKEAAPEKQPEPAKPQQPESKDQPEIVDVEHEGKTYKVPADLKDAFLRQSDYTRKTQEVAKDRAAAMQERQALQQLTQQAGQVGEYQAALKQIDGHLQQLQNVNWQQLYATDRQQWLEYKQLANDLMQSRHGIAGQIQSFQQNVNAYEQARHQEAVGQGIEVIRKAIPDFGPEHQKALSDTAQSLGFSPDEVRTVVDPRQVLVLHELKNLREKVAHYEAQEQAAAKQIRTAPRMVRPEAKPDPQTSAPRNEALARLKKSGSDEDAMESIKHLLG